MLSKARTVVRALARSHSAVAYNANNIPIKQTQLFIGNEFVEAQSGRRFDVINPATGDVICDAAEADAADIDLAVAAAKQAFTHGSEWRTMDASNRGALMMKLAEAIDANAPYLAALETLDNGKPYFDSLYIDIPLSSKVLKYYAGWCDKIHGKTIPSDGPTFTYTKHEPVGVVGGITPWNFPMLMLAWKLSPILACGNTAVMKVAEQTPLSALYVAKLARDVGFPEGVINILAGYGPTAGGALARHMDVNKIGFTGSTEVGKIIQQESGKSNLKRVTLELGGKSPNIVFADCDLDRAATESAFGLFFNVGQCCCAGSRIYVQEEIYDEFVKRMVDIASQRVLGDPFAASTNHGPQIDDIQLKKILDLVKSGQDQGASLQFGGDQFGDKGYFMNPTVFADVEDNMDISTQEIFGPVMQISKFKTKEEVIHRANDSNYGLAAAVFSNNVHTINHMTSALQAGTVWVNCYNALMATNPFGGYKESGFGRDLGEYALQHYTEVKCVTNWTAHKNS